MSSSAVEAMRDRYPTWRSLLHSRFNLLFYGSVIDVRYTWDSVRRRYGSKTPLLSDFADEGLDDGYVVRIEGYMASPRGMSSTPVATSSTALYLLPRWSFNTTPMSARNLRFHISACSRCQRCDLAGDCTKIGTMHDSGYPHSSFRCFLPQAQLSQYHAKTSSTPTRIYLVIKPSISYRIFTCIHTFPRPKMILIKSTPLEGLPRCSWSPWIAKIEWNWHF